MVAIPATNIAVLKQNGCLGLAQGRLGSACYDGNRRKVGDEHSQDVLETEGDGLGDWHPASSLYMLLMLQLVLLFMIGSPYKMIVNRSRRFCG